MALLSHSVRCVSGLKSEHNKLSANKKSLPARQFCFGVRAQLISSQTIDLRKLLLRIQRPLNNYSRSLTYTSWWGPLLALRCSSCLLWGSGNPPGCISGGISSESNLWRRSKVKKKRILIKWANRRKKAEGLHHRKMDRQRNTTSRQRSNCNTQTHTRSRDKQRVSRLMESWPAMKDVPPREMSELGLGSRFFTMFSITLSTVSIRPLATTVDCCSTQTQSGFRLRLWVLLKQEIGVHPFKHNLPKSVARQPLRTNVGMNKTWITVA